MTMLVHGSNLAQKEQHRAKYLDAASRTMLAEIRAAYDKWHQDNMKLIGPAASPGKLDEKIVGRRVKLFEQYKTFIDNKKYAEQFDSRSNLHSSAMEEFLYYLFRDLVADFGKHALIGKSRTFKDIFFMPSNFKAMVEQPHANVERKDHDFVIGVSVAAHLKNISKIKGDEANVRLQGKHSSKHESQVETHFFDIPAVVIECKTYLDKTMLEGASQAAEELKARNPNSIYLVVMEWLKLTEAINLRKYKVDQIYVFRRQKNTDREFRFAPNYVKNQIDAKVVFHLFEFVRKHLTVDWEGGVRHGLERGWLL